ncbi:hypothetical protein SDC9_205366 [bioreactor metagenome]|uniref:Uncharacterized protein n=1 Tax=bioreactor metagenome TaxID=1076179 RepID=A0A645J3I8_9ZZZZ
MVGNGTAEFGMQFLVDVHQRRRDFHTRPDRKTHAVGLVWPVIRILAQDHGLDFAKRGGLQGVKNIMFGRIYSMGVVLPD